MTSHNSLEPVRRAIVQRLILSPKTENQLREILKGYDLIQIREALRDLMADGTIACTNKRFWLRGVGKADLRKAEYDREQEEGKRYG